MQIKIDPEFKGSIPQLSGDTKWFAIHMASNGNMWAADITPHQLDGYFHVAVFDPSHSVNYTKRGVIGAAVEITLKAYGFDFPNVEWESEKSSRYVQNPYEPTKKKQKEIADHDALEKGLEQEVVKLLGGVSQVHCTAGIADIVTDTSIIEVKYRLTRSNLFSAIGQVLMYRQAINATLKPFVVGYRSTDDVSGIVEAAQDMGITVIFWGEQ